MLGGLGVREREIEAGEVDFLQLGGRLNHVLGLFFALLEKLVEVGILYSRISIMKKKSEQDRLLNLEKINKKKAYAGCFVL
jgi:hypothetical protein